MWDDKVATLKGVGPKILEKLHKLSINTVGDLLLHCPFRYEDRTHLTPLRDVLPESWVLVQGNIIDVKLVQARKKRLILQIADKTGVLKLVFFHFHPLQQKQWKVGSLMRCYGQPKISNMGLSITHPEYEMLDPDLPKPLPQHLTPIYHTVQGLHQAWLRKTIAAELDQYIHHYQEDEDRFAQLFAVVKPMYQWLEALKTIHRPKACDNEASLVARQHPAYQRLIIEELYAHRMSLTTIRDQSKAQNAPAYHVTEADLKPFFAQLPFTLTNAQQRVWQEIQADLSSKRPMLRLVQGDVGCGKTIIAALSSFAACKHDAQVAIMVPTEILAEQHFTYFSQLFSPLGIRCELLVGQLKAKAKRSVRENCQLGLANIVIGTHALFQEDIQFKRLGLVIIDEQHRFGVHQRLALQNKGLTSGEAIACHQLIMTATPIPRTLAMSHYAHLDISVIDSLPPNRLPITTIVLPQTRRDEVIDRIQVVCEKGQQVYWVCTLIEESEELSSQAAESTAVLLQETLTPLRVGLVHGKMPSDQKEAIMQAFYAKQIHILVATTVIEVGVNVPNATLMVIENPERLGLAQLHQLRGRVGRGDQASFCVLLYQGPLSEMAQARLKIMRDSQDGFVIAQADLELRGPGEFLGTKQTGAIQFKIADFQRDGDVIRSLASLSETRLSQTHTEKIINRWCGGRQYINA